MSETMVNQLNERGQEDLVRYSEAEVRDAKAKSQAAAAALADSRTDPESLIRRSRPRSRCR